VVSLVEGGKVDFCGYGWTVVTTNHQWFSVSKSLGASEVFPDERVDLILRGSKGI